MSSNYPGGIDSYTTKVDGSSPIVAADINNPQAAIVAIENELGADPSVAPEVTPGASPTSVVELLGMLKKQIHNVTNGTNWYTAPATTLTAVVTSLAAKLSGVSTGKGDVLAGNNSSGFTILSAGSTTGDVLTLDPTTTLGVKWATPTGGTSAGSPVLISAASTTTPDATNNVTPHTISGLSTTFTLASSTNVLVLLGVPTYITSTTSAGSGYMDILVDGSPVLGTVLIGRMSATSQPLKFYAHLMYEGTLAAGSHTIGATMHTDSATTSIEAMTDSARGTLTVLNVDASGGGGSGGTGVSYICIRDNKGASDGGSFTNGGWRERDLTEVQSDSDSVLVSLTANQFTLPAGTYGIRATAPAYKVNNHQARLMDITNNVPLIYGKVMYTSAADGIVTDSLVAGGFTLSSQTTLAVWHQCVTTQSSNGYGVASVWDDNIYTVVEIFKLS